MRYLLALLLLSCGREFPDLFGCDEPKKVIEVPRGDFYSLDSCWNDKETERHCCLYKGVDFPCQQTVCSSDCYVYETEGVICEDAPIRELF